MSIPGPSRNEFIRTQKRKMQHVSNAKCRIFETACMTIDLQKSKLTTCFTMFEFERLVKQRAATIRQVHAELHRQREPRSN